MGDYLKRTILILSILMASIKAFGQDSIQPNIEIQYSFSTFDNFKFTFNELLIKGGVQYNNFNFSVGYGFHFDNATLYGFSRDQQRKFEFLSFEFDFRFKKNNIISPSVGLCANLPLRTFNNDIIVSNYKMMPSILGTETYRRYYTRIDHFYSLYFDLSYRIKKINLYGGIGVSLYFARGYYYLLNLFKRGDNWIAPAYGPRIGIKYQL